MQKIPVGILGATGMVGQQYLRLLANHPWFEIAFLCASPRSAGKSYAEAVHQRWHQSTPIPHHIRKMPVYAIDAISEAQKRCRFVFSAIGSDLAKQFEELYAAAGLPVISNASYHRNSLDVPVLIPEINANHLSILPKQQASRGWSKGFIVTKPNCSIQSYMLPLAPLHAQFEIKHLHITTLQAISGAGYPGVSSWDIYDNVIPYIAKEEEKSEKEPLKIFGEIAENQIVSHPSMKISAHCNRVPVLDGHLACVSVEFKKQPSQEDILHIWQTYTSLPQQLKLPSAPEQTIIYREEVNRPQPRLDREAGKGMAVTVGRLRPCHLMHYRFVALSHNTLRGAAGGGILNAELLTSQGYLT